MWKMEQVCVYPAALPSETEIYMCPFMQLSQSICAISHESLVISHITAMLPTPS